MNEPRWGHTCRNSGHGKRKHRLRLLCYVVIVVVLPCIHSEKCDSDPSPVESRLSREKQKGTEAKTDNKEEKENAK